MPFLSGSLSLRRYAVIGDVPDSLSRTATVAIRRYAWRPIDDERGEKESFGWINPRDVLNDRFTWPDVVTQHVMLLGVRRDRKSFSPVLYRARRARLFEDVKKERGITRLSRQQRIALEEQLTIEMLKETSASSAFTEVLWDLNSKLFFMAATSTTLCERIQEVFEATFDLRLRPVYPALTGADYIASQGLEDSYHEATAAGEAVK